MKYQSHALCVTVKVSYKLVVGTENLIPIFPRPLSELTEKNVKWEWNEKKSGTLNRLKTRLTTA